MLRMNKVQGMHDRFARGLDIVSYSDLVHYDGTNDYAELPA
jgi:hypothetical protein